MKMIEKWWAPEGVGGGGAAGPGGQNADGGSGPGAGGDGGSAGLTGSSVNVGAPARPDSGRAPTLDGGPQPDAGGFDWGALGTAGDDTDIETVDTGEQPEVQEPEETEQPEPQQPERQEPQRQEPQPQERQEPQRRPGVEGFLDTMVEKRSEIIDAVSKMRFALSEDDVKAIEKDFVAQLPNLAARVWYEAYTSSINWMMQQMPSMMRGEMKKFGSSMRAEGDFYQAWPGLDRDQHHSQVLQFGRVYRQMYPQASVQDFIRDVGTMVATAAGLQGGYRPPAVGGNGGQQPRRAQSGAAGQQRPGIRQQVEVFTPAGTGGGGPRAQSGRRAAQSGANPFEGLGRDYDEEEL